jgi:hypothetical protein
MSLNVRAGWVTFIMVVFVGWGPGGIGCCIELRLGILGKERVINWIVCISTRRAVWGLSGELIEVEFGCLV